MRSGDDAALAEAAVLAGRPCTPADPDLQLSLWMLYELHYGGFEDVDDDFEWSPGVLDVRRSLESALAGHLSELAAPALAAVDPAATVGEQLTRLVGADPGPSVAAHIRRHATVGQVRELFILRSIYTLKEADPHSWAIPRLTGAPKVALLDVQYDEYGAGRPHHQHARLFADAMEAIGLETSYGAYIDVVPAEILLVNNAMSFFGLHRRMRGACMGHLAAFEATSSSPARQIARGLERLGLPDPCRRYFDEHVVADAAHEQVARHDICERMVDEGQASAESVVFGAAACLALDGLVGEQVLAAWQRGRSAVIEPARARTA